MPQTHDIGGKKFVALMKYPKGSRPPLWEFGVESREYEPPFRIGFGWSFRIPGSRRALVVGTWQDEGGDEDERLRAALRSRDMNRDVDEIKEWAG